MSFAEKFYFSYEDIARDIYMYMSLGYPNDYSSGSYCCYIYLHVSKTQARNLAETMH